MGHLFWLSDAQWAAIEPYMPQNQPGARRVDGRTYHSCVEGRVPMVRLPEFNRWSRKRFWLDLAEALATSGAGRSACIQSLVSAGKSARSTPKSLPGRLPIRARRRFGLCQKSIWQALRKLGVTHENPHSPKAELAHR